MAREVKFIPTLTEDIENLPYSEGQLVVDITSNKVAVDASSERFVVVDPDREGNWSISNSRREWNSKLTDIADWVYDDSTGEPHATVDYEVYVFPEITFHTNGGTDVQNISIPVGESLAEYSLPLTEREGYIFEGWYREPEFINLYELPAVMPAVTEHAYAQWTENPEL